MVPGLPSDSQPDPRPRSPLSQREPESTGPTAKKFRIQRNRLGEVKFVREDGEFGFIRSEDFREDVFFHRTTWEGSEDKPPMAEMVVEFELDDDHFEQTQKLRAKSVRPTDRPMGRKMTARDATFELTYHHPKARRKRPSWRDKEE